MSRRDRELEQEVQQAVYRTETGRSKDAEPEDGLWDDMEDWAEDDFNTPLGMRGCHRQPNNDFHKVNVRGNKEHVYSYANGDQFTVTVGQNDVTQKHVNALNRAHNRCVESNCRNKLQPKSEAEKMEEAAEAAEALRLGLKKPKPHKRKPVLSLDGFFSEAGEHVIDSMACFAEPKSQNGVEGMLGLEEAPVIDALREAIDALPNREKRALQLVWLEGYSITQAAKMEGCRHESTLRMRLNRALTKLRENEKLSAEYFRS